MRIAVSPAASAEDAVIKRERVPQQRQIFGLIDVDVSRKEEGNKP